MNIMKISDVANQLFSYLPPERFSTFSCGHIIPPDNLQTLVVNKGPRGSDLEYKAGKQRDATVVRRSPVYLRRLGLTSTDCRSRTNIAELRQRSAIWDDSLLPVV